jgi:hypothetical protein
LAVLRLMITSKLIIRSRSCQPIRPAPRASQASQRSHSS